MLLTGSSHAANHLLQWRTAMHACTAVQALHGAPGSNSVAHLVTASS